MKRAASYVIAGAVAGFAGVLGLHARTAAAPVAGAPSGRSTPPAGPTASPAVTPATPSGPVRRAAGVLEQYGYGELSVTVTVRGGQIVNVSVPFLRTAEPTSQEIAAQALPMLRSEVLAAHGGRINAVSGATYTSQAYAASIQSALDKLHVR